MLKTANLVPRVSPLHVPAPWDVKRRDPGNEVGKQQDLGHVLGKPKLFTCIKFHSARTRPEEKKLRMFLEEKLDASLLIGNHVKPPL